MKYKMQIEVEAEQFIPEDNKIPEGVTSDGPRSPSEDPRASWVLRGPSGTVYLSSGDYVITDPNGDKSSMSKEHFEKLYKPVVAAKK